MSYTITITEDKTETRIARGKYGFLYPEFISEGQYAVLDPSEQKDWKHVDGQYQKDIFGYEPDKKTGVQTSTEVYKQVVSSLDLVAVIAAINTVSVKE